VLTLDEVADQSAALARRQRPIRGFADERVTEQGDLASPLLALAGTA
jgi:hypothetical protein